MTELLDAVHWQALLPLDGPVACYRDGSLSQWPPEAVTALRTRIVVNITVLADPAWEMFDSETGNAGVDSVARAVKARLSKGLWSGVYVNEDLHQAQTDALLAQGVQWTDAKEWPAPGCYLWAAAPGTTPGITPLWCPVPPIAVQDRWMGDHDVSTCYGSFPVVVVPPAPQPKPPPPAPPPEVTFDMKMPQIKQGVTSDEVRALQILLNGRHGNSLTVDGIYGPKTESAVRAYQYWAGISVDGIAGLHTWSRLLGVPQ